MHWIIQKPFEYIDSTYNDRRTLELIDILKRASIPYSEHKVIPFVGEIVPDINPEGQVVVIGAYALRRVAQRKNWTPGSWDLYFFTYEEQVKRFGSNMLNYDARFVNFEDVVNLWFNGDLFIKPAHDSKAFPGQVYSKEEFSEWHHKVLSLEENEYGLSRDTLTVMSIPKNIATEYRFWIVNNKVVTYSLYKRGDTVFYSSQVDKVVIDYVQNLVDKNLIPEVKGYVMDVCELVDGGFKIVEFNTLNAAGFYAADLNKLIDAIEIS